MRRALESLETISADEKMRELHRAREKARKDMISKLHYAKQQGIKQGIEQGVTKTAEEMFKLGLDIKIIMKATNLPEDELEEIEKRISAEIPRI